MGEGEFVVVVEELVVWRGFESLHCCFGFWG